MGETMIEAIKLWNEPNNLSHWDFTIDPEWKEYVRMTRSAAERVRALCPSLRRVLGGISPIDPSFIALLGRHGLLASVDVVAVHGFPLDWNHWQLEEWPKKIEAIEKVTDLPVWVTEVGVSTFGADEVQRFGLQRTTALLLGRVERLFWYSLLDLPPAWEATTRHKESEGSSYYRHFYMGLVRDDGTPKPALDCFNPEMGICQWFHFQDHRLESAVAWLRRMGVKKLRTGLSWADWHRPGAIAWFDHQLAQLAEFDLTLTLCFTPPSRGRLPHHTSPPLVPEEFAGFAEWVVRRYVLGEKKETDMPRRILEPMKPEGDGIAPVRSDR
ncbi:MAG: glycosyl hydrolase [Candidatus Manganitrophus sp. SA1]|nr:glycosyl hydrolase [Candidatus Manganitrophus morganii]